MNQEQKHSSEPWRLSATFGVASDIGQIASTAIGHRSIETKKANAERIVLCVNFCAGLTNEELKDHRNASYWKTRAETLDEIRPYTLDVQKVEKECDDLLTQLADAHKEVERLKGELEKALSGQKPDQRKENNAL